jgi:hypothetical protein
VFKVLQAVPEQQGSQAPQETQEILDQLEQ